MKKFEVILAASVICVVICVQQLVIQGKIQRQSWVPRPKHTSFLVNPSPHWWPYSKQHTARKASCWLQDRNMRPDDLMWCWKSKIQSFHSPSLNHFEDHPEVGSRSSSGCSYKFGEPCGGASSCWVQESTLVFRSPDSVWKTNQKRSQKPILKRLKSSCCNSVPKVSEKSRSYQAIT